MKETKDEKTLTWLGKCRKSIAEADLTKKTSEYNGLIGKYILELCKTFDKQKEQTTLSAEQTVKLFAYLVLNNGELPKE